MMNTAPQESKASSRDSTPHTSIDVKAVTEFVGLVAQPDTSFQLFLLGPKKGGQDQTLTMTFAVGDDIDAAARAVASYLETMPAWVLGVYYRLNPLPSAWAENKPKVTARDVDILRRAHFMIDVDAPKELGFEFDMAKESGLAEARRVADEIRASLLYEGWGNPLASVFSGRGVQLVYRCDLPNDDDSQKILREMLHRLARLYGKGVVDRCVHNAGRLARLPGTWNRKGRALAGRPYRLAGVLASDPASGPITAGQIMAAFPADGPSPDTLAGGWKPRPTPGGDRRTYDTDAKRQKLVNRCIAYTSTIPHGTSGEGGSCPMLWLCRAVLWGFDLTLAEGEPIIMDYAAGCTPPLGGPGTLSQDRRGQRRRRVWQAARLAPRRRRRW